MDKIKMDMKGQDLTYKKFTPSLEYGRYVHSYWSMESNESYEQTFPDLLIPDGCIEVIFILKGGYKKRNLHDVHIQVIDASTIVGIQDKTVLVKRTGKVKMVGIKFKPIGFFKLFGWDGRKTAGKTIGLHEFNDVSLTEMETILSKITLENVDASTIENILFNGRPLLKFSEKEAAVEAAVDKTLETNGNLSVQELCKSIYKSERQLQRYFKTYVGLSPKKFGNLIRFKELYKNNVLKEIPEQHFHDYGYFDQNHFIKDYKKNLGTTPSKRKGPEFRKLNKIARMSTE